MTPRELEKNALIELKQIFKNEREQVLANEIVYLLCYTLKISKEKLIIDRDIELTENQTEHFLELLNRRKNFEPLAYLIGEQEFFSLNFKVSKDVLIPRPETELLVQQALLEVENFKSIVDIGSGSGAIIVSIAKHASNLRYFALDISPAACEMTKKNSKLNQVNIEVINSDLLDGLPNLEYPILFVSNPPYIPESEQLMPDVQNYEPKLALRAGSDGLDIIKRLLVQFQAQVLKNSRNILLIEIGAGQHNDVKCLAQELRIDTLEMYRDFQDIIRVIKLGKK